MSEVMGSLEKKKKTGSKGGGRGGSELEETRWA